LGEENIEL